MYKRMFIQLSHQLRNRDKHSIFIKYIGLPVGFILSGLFPLLSGRFIIEEPGFIGGIFLMVMFFNILFISFNFSKRLAIYIKNIVLFPFSLYHHFSFIVLQGLYSSGAVLFTIAIFSTGIILSKDILSMIIFILMATTVFLCFEIWIINIFLFSFKYIEYNKNILNYLLPPFFLLSQIPVFVKKAIIYNFYPFSGWIGSATNASQSGEYGTVAFYFSLVFLSLIIGFWIGQFLVKPGKKVRWV